MKNISKNEPAKTKKSVKIILPSEFIKRKSKKLYHCEKLQKLHGNAKQNWKVMKEIIRKAKLLHFSHLPQKITVNKIDLFDKAKNRKRIQ